jgi:hypothetical protein
MAAANQYPTNQPAAPFLLETQGYIQGLALDDPTSRLWLVEGTLVSTATVALWGGLPVTEQINVTGAGADGLGPVVSLATTQAGVTGWSTFQQMMHMTIAPNQNVPVAGPTNGLGFFRLNTQVRLAVACDPALITSITGGGDSIASQSLYWDVTNYRITLNTAGGNFALPTSIKLLSVNTNSKIVSVASPASAAVPAWALGSAAIILI